MASNSHTLGLILSLIIGQNTYVQKSILKYPLGPPAPPQLLRFPDPWSLLHEGSWSIPHSLSQRNRGSGRTQRQTRGKFWLADCDPWVLEGTPNRHNRFGKVVLVSKNEVSSLRLDLSSLGLGAKIGQWGWWEKPEAAAVIGFGESVGSKAPGEEVGMVRSPSWGRGRRALFP